MQRDVLLWTASRLSGPWSAGEITGSLTSDLLERITDAFDRLDPLVRVRLLIACAFLKVSRREELAKELHALARKASSDDNEWVRMYGLVLGGMDGKMHLQRALETFPVVEQTVRELEASAAQHSASADFARPLEDQYLSERLLRKRGYQAEAPSHTDHFHIRDDGAQVGAQLSGIRPGAATSVAAAAASSAGRHSDILSGVRAVPVAQPKRREDAEAKMFVKSSHTWKAPAPPPTSIPTSTAQKAQVLDSTELTLSKPSSHGKRRAAAAAEGDASGFRRPAARGGGGGAPGGQSAGAASAAAQHGPGHAGQLAEDMPGDASDAAHFAQPQEMMPGETGEDEEDEPAPNMF